MISELAKNKLKGNSVFIGKMMAEFDKTERTMYNWLDRNDPMLTTVAALRIIKEETGLTDSEILLEEKATA